MAGKRKYARMSTRKGSAPMSTDIAVARNISQGNIYRTVRTVSLGAITAGLVDTGVGRRFRLSDVPGSSDFTNLFDQYRIVAVEAIYVFSTHILASQARYPRITFCVDYSDASNPASENAILEYQNAESFQFGQVKHTFKRVLKPRAALGAFEGAFTGYGMAPLGMWFDAADSAIEYYGTKEWLSNYNTTIATGAQVNVYHRYHLEFKNSR
jgi:hypothetical protein